MIHTLKTHHQPFAAMRAGVKRFEYRRDDRAYEVGDDLLLHEYDPAHDSYTGEVLLVRVTYLLRGPDFGIADGYVCMSVEPVEPSTRATFTTIAASLKDPR